MSENAPLVLHPENHALQPIQLGFLGLFTDQSVPVIMMAHRPGFAFAIPDDYAGNR